MVNTKGFGECTVEMECAHDLSGEQETDTGGEAVFFWLVVDSRLHLLARTAVGKPVS